MAGKPSGQSEPKPSGQALPPVSCTPCPNNFLQVNPVEELLSATSFRAWLPVMISGMPSRSMSAMVVSDPSPLLPKAPPSLVCGQSVLPVAPSNTPLPTTTCAGPVGPRRRAMVGAPHQTDAARVSQRKRPLLPKAMRPPRWWALFGSTAGLQFGGVTVAVQGWSLGSQPPVMKQASPVPMQSPAAMLELAFTLWSRWLRTSAGALQIGEPSDPWIARITPCDSRNWPPSLLFALKVLKTTAGSVSAAWSRMTTGVL